MAGGDQVLVEDALGGAAEARELALLAGERLDDPDAGDVLLGVGGQAETSINSPLSTSYTNPRS